MEMDGNELRSLAGRQAGSVRARARARVCTNGPLQRRYIDARWEKNESGKKKRSGMIERYVFHPLSTILDPYDVHTRTYVGYARTIRKYLSAENP